MSMPRLQGASRAGCAQGLLSPRALETGAFRVLSAKLSLAPSPQLLLPPRCRAWVPLLLMRFGLTVSF